MHQTAFPFRRLQRECTTRFFVISNIYTNNAPKGNGGPVLLRNAIKIAEIILGLILLVTVLNLVLQCLLGQQGGFFVYGLKMRGNTTNVR